MREHMLAMVVRGLDMKATLVPVIVDSTDSGQQILEKVKAKQQQWVIGKSRTCYLNLLWTRLEIAVAEIKWNATRAKPDYENGTRVDLARFERNIILTEALRYPDLLANESNFILEHENLTLREEDEWRNLAGQQVVVLYTVGDKEKIAWLLLLLLLLSPALGIIVGHFSGQADVGVAIGVGIFALASFLQGLATWFHH